MLSLSASRSSRLRMQHDVGEILRATPALTRKPRLPIASTSPRAARRDSASRSGVAPTP